MNPITKPREFGIGELSRQTDVNIETIRYYERIGVMPKPARTDGGNRTYQTEQAKRLFFVKRSRDLGFSLKEIRSLLQMVDRQDFTCGQIHDVTIRQLENIQQKISDLKKLEKTLGQMAEECSNGDIPYCPIIDTLFE